MKMNQNRKPRPPTSLLLSVVPAGEETPVPPHPLQTNSKDLKSWGHHLTHDPGIVSNPAGGRAARRSLAAWPGCCWGEAAYRSQPNLFKTFYVCFILNVLE